ncbi:T9SS C-terminal target domain-containing protein [Nafulsella turpanensis]|uniref:T9SS C-terminal target domain-containing protein n=1 Tax=Nafulsella turpanensis TaxID=1265690 RepID=UPI00035ECA04|nr:T9SS C-terminal target domain-containing protein [Nafulsella turpanensis]
MIKGRYRLHNLYRLWVIPLLMCLAANLQAQSGPYLSRDNHSGLTHQPSSWDGPMPVGNITNLTDTKVTVRGYLIHGSEISPSNASFSGTGSMLVVEDTLRIHGDLSILNGAGLHIKQGGVLIVHGNYLQKDGVTFYNEGTAVFIGSWKWAGTGSYNNAGVIYSQGSVSGGVGHKSMTDLWEENPSLYHFVGLKVLKEDCIGTSGSLTVSGEYSRVVRWESSIDFFKSDITTISSRESTYSYSNLQETTSFRVYLETSPGQYGYSSGATIVVLEASQGGAISGPTAAMCGSVNSGTLSLNNFIGSVLRWESSADGFATAATVATGGESYSFGNLSQTTSFRAIVKNGSCGEASSTIFTVEVSPESKGGELSGSTSVCAGENSGSLLLSGYTGAVLRWESSTDGGATFQPIDFTGAEYFYENLSTTTSFRAVVQSGSCAVAYSTVASIAVSTVAGGALSGGQAVCAGENSGTLSLSGYAGEILRWERSVDGFATTENIAHTADSFVFGNLNQTTRYRAVIGGTACAPVYSTVAEVVVEEQVIAGEITTSASSVCAGSNEGSLTLNGYSGQILRWESSTDGFATQIDIINYQQAVYTYQNLPATTSFRAVVGNESCGEFYSASATIEVKAPAVGGTLAGAKRVKAGENTGTLHLEDYFGTIVQWEWSADAFATDVQVLNHTGTTYTFENLKQDTWFRVLVQQGDCSPVYSAPAKMWMNQAPMAMADTFYVEPASKFTSSISLLQNDYDPDGDPLVITAGQHLSTTEGNRLDIQLDGNIYFEPSSSFRGTDTYQYRICDDAGEASQCSFGTLVLVVKDKPVTGERKVIVYDGFSPNGDGKNESWIIEHIEQYEDNFVQVFDRYGVLVFEAVGYNNHQKVFEGYSNKGAIGGGSLLPEATYFYRIVLDREQPVITGYFILNR